MIFLYCLTFLTIQQEQNKITVDEYRNRLIEIRAAVVRGDLKQVRKMGKSLLSCKIVHFEKDLLPDTFLLKPLAEAKDVSSFQLFADRIDILVEALKVVAEKQQVKPDRVLLERLRSEETVDEIKPGGKIDHPNVERRGLFQIIGDKISEIVTWVGKQIVYVINWFGELFFGGASGTGTFGSQTIIMVLVVIIVILLAVFGFNAWRRNRIVDKDPIASSMAPRMRSRDEDPLSRTSSEWERFAQELIKAGRFREAIRAWYHALLTGLFRTGYLHHRKDKTNWEYANSLSPQLQWRSDFIEAIRNFEVEWYGRRSTDQEKVAIYTMRVRKILGSAGGRGE